MVLFDNGNTEESLLFVKNFNMMIISSGTLAANARLQYIRILLRGKVLSKFDKFCVKVGSTTIAHLNRFILILVISPPCVCVF